MAPRISSLYCLIIIASLIDCRAGGSLKLSLGFTALSPPEVTALRNHPLLLNCSGYSEEGPLQISWRFQDADIKDKHLVTFSNGSLYIDRLVSQKKRERRWDGNYTCVLRNNVGLLISRPVHVIIARMSKSFVYEPQPLTTYEGGQARFSCQINAVPAATVSWYKDGIELPQNDSRFTTLSSGVLQITGVSMNDGGDYKCRCSNVAKQKNSSEATLTVVPRIEQYRPPVFFDTSDEVIAVKGESAVLECFADGSPKVDFSWRRKDGKEISEHFLGNSNLFFPKVQHIHSGSYICSAKVTNKETSQIIKEETREIFLRVYVPPTFTKVPVSQTIPTSQTVRFDCEVESNPASSIYWVKDGEQLYINGRIKLKPGNTLVVSHTVTSDSGIYQCVASNPAGVNTTAARLQVNVSSDQPHPPSGLKAVTMSSSAILLSWEPVYSPASSPIQAYTVHYVPTNGGPEQNAVAVNTSLLIDRLKPYTNYTFYVRAYNNKSASEPSKPIVQMTGEDVPLIAPKVTLSSKSPTTLHVQWNELPLDKTRGVIIEHRLYFRKYMQASYNVQTIKAGNEYTITGLTPKQKYEVRVLSGTKAGFPALSEEVWPWLVYEMPDILTSKVPSSPILHLTVINATALEVEWSMPNDNPYPVSGYYLSYRPHNLPLKHVTLPANDTKYQLFDLVPQSWYEVHLVAFNENGESRESVRNIITFSGDNPNAETVEVVEPPHQLEAEPTSSTSIHLTWKMPITNRNISYYTVRYHPVFASGLVNESYIYYIRSTNNEVLITDLQPFTFYEFSVRSHDVHKRQGPFSQVVECRTVEDLPSPPEDLSWSPIDANSVRINWQPPKHPNGIITGYRIMYSSRIDESNLDLWNSKEEKGTESTAVLTGLVSNTHYYLCMKARNGAGLSPPTPIISVNIPVRYNNSKFPSPETFDAEPPDPFLGIVLGISIGVGCIIICAVIIICRNRCCATQDAGSDGRYSVCCGNGYIPHLNGHIMGNPPAEKRVGNAETQEMECFTPMLNTFTNGSNERHLDTKGGYPSSMCNGKANGFPHQFLVNSRSSLGSHQGSTTSAHLSESEDHPAVKHCMRYTAKDCKVSDNNWQDETADVTSSTVLLESANQTLSTSTLPVEDGASSQWENKPPSPGAKNNTEVESSCITESKCSHVESSPKTLTICTVPPVSPTSSSHCPPSDCESDQNSVPSGEQSQKVLQCTKDNANMGDCEPQSLPFSVNAFLSPLSGPRFSQSSNPESILEPT